MGTVGPPIYWSFDVPDRPEVKSTSRQPGADTKIGPPASPRPRDQDSRYRLKQPKPLLREMLDTDFESEHHRKFRANRSLRDVEPEVNLFLKDLSGMQVEDHT